MLSQFVIVLMNDITAKTHQTFLCYTLPCWLLSSFSGEGFLLLLQRRVLPLADCPGLCPAEEKRIRSDRHRVLTSLHCQNS